MEYKYVKATDIKVDSALIGIVSFKQKVAPIICFIFGIAIMFVASIWAKILGTFFVIMAMFVFRFVEDKRTIDVYQNGVVIYNAKDNDLAFYLPFDDVKQWKASREGGHDSIIFELNNGQKTGVDTFQLDKAYEYLIKACPKKEEREVQREKNKKMKFANPLETLKNLGQKFSKKK